MEANPNFQLDLKKLPYHIAIIMDGNGRWAKQRGQPRLFGHHQGVKTVREITEACAEIGIKWLTLYAFSTENWNRPILEVTGLMGLLLETTRKELDTLLKNDIRLNIIGDVNKLPEATRKVLQEAVIRTKDNKGLCLSLALNYSARWEILDAVNRIIKENPEILVTEDVFRKALASSEIPDPELLIRTSGEKRISNFLLWQCAYTEFYFTDILWPDFSKSDLYLAIENYQQRERRFGQISEQLV